MRVTCIGLARIMVGTRYVLQTSAPPPSDNDCLLVPFGGVLRAGVSGRQYLERYFGAYGFSNVPGQELDLNFEVDDDFEEGVVEWLLRRDKRETGPRRPVEYQLERHRILRNLPVDRRGITLQPAKAVQKPTWRDPPGHKVLALIEVHDVTLSTILAIRLTDAMRHPKTSLCLVSVAEIQQGHLFESRRIIVSSTASALVG